MTVLQLTSRDNPLLKKFRLVSSGSRRAPKELVIAEGIRVLEEAERAASDIDAVVVSADFGSVPRERALLDHWLSRGVRLCKTSASLFHTISTVETPQGATALVRVLERRLDSVSATDDSLILCASGIQDPGNLGTLIRTAAAAGASLVCTSGGTVSARSPKAIRSSAGAFFRIPVAEHTKASELCKYCRIHSIRIYRTDAREGVLYTEADLKSRCAILLGNEGSGIASGEFQDCPAIRIPMAEGIESLNVAIAGAVILFEALRQRL